MDLRAVTLENMGEFYAKYYRFAVGICAQHGAGDMAEDLASDTFVRLIRKFHVWQRDCDLTSWLWVMCKNETLMWKRKASTKKESSFEAFNMRLVHGTTVGRCAAGDNMDAVRKLTDQDLCHHQAGENGLLASHILKRLPKGYREVLWLHDVMGYQHEEVAKILGVAAGTSKSQLHKARLRAIQIMNEQARPRVPSAIGPTTEGRRTKRLAAA